MKILSLDLLAFGPFTGVSLPLEGGQHGLHIIYGANEAGKSSALRALHQMLYGIPHNSSDNFIHPHQDLRIGARLQIGTGDELTCIRRKGRSNTLRGPDDVEVVDPSLLAGMLNGVDEKAFRQRFGIDYNGLVEGGKAIVEGGGDLGEILFAAGSGVANLRQVQQRLAKQAEELFKARGSTQRINKAMVDLAKANQDIKAAQLPSAEWVKHDESLSQAQDRKQTNDKHLLEKGSEQARLERIDKALPIMARRHKLRGELANLGNAPLLPADFSEVRGETIAKLEAARDSEREAAGLIEQLDKNIGELEVPHALPQHSTAIEQLYRELSRHQKAADDRPGLAFKQQQLEDEARAILRDLGRKPELSEADALRISRLERQRIQNLGFKRESLEKTHAGALARVQKLTVEIQRIKEQLAKSQSLPDADELRRAVRRARQHGDLDERLDGLRAELRQAEQQAAVDLQKLRLWTGTLEQLEKLPVPMPETIEQFASQLDRVAGDVAHLELRIAEIDEDLQELEQRIQRLRLQQDVPTEEDLATARWRRDEGWRLVERAWQQSISEGEEVQRFVAQFPPAGDLAEAFEASVAQCDHVADRLRREATHVAERAQLMAARQKKAGRLDELAGKLQQAIARHHAIQQNWLDHWRPLEIEALTPREMRTWAGQQAGLVTAAETIRQRQTNLRELEMLVAACRQDLSQCLARTGYQPVEPGESCFALLDRCEDLVGQMEYARVARQNLQQDLQKLQEQLPEDERLADQAARELEGWREHWAEAMRRLSLYEDTNPSEANSVLDAIDELFSKLKDGDQLQQRIRGIDRDSEQFSKNVRRLLQLVAGDLMELPVAQAVEDLHDRLTTAQRIQARLEELIEQHKRESTKRDKARASMCTLQTTIATMCREAGCETAQQLPEAELRSTHRQSREQKLQELDESLLDFSANAPLEKFLAEAAQVNPDRLQPEIQQLASDIKQLEKDRDDQLGIIATEQTLLRQMDGSAKAAWAHEKAQSLLAQLRTDAEEYIRLRLASAILRSAIERYRDKNQDPVLHRASDLFAELTLGSFQGLRADYNERGEAVLVGVRPGGEPIAIDEMSDGTCDQLYLALRLASLETYLANNDPIPFIVDDILIKFDDDRAVAALKVLARLSQRTQVILFTHHEHLLKLVQDNLHEDILFIHELGVGRTPVEESSGRI